VKYHPPIDTDIYFVDSRNKNRRWRIEDRTLLVRGTPGAGDFMFTMSSAFYLSHLLQIPIHLIYYWKHGPDYVHHPEDPESIFEKIDYFHSMCHEKENVTYQHVYNFDVDDLFQGEMILNLWDVEISGASGTLVPYMINSWKFNSHVYDNPTTDKKVVMWRSRFNSETPAAWKTSYSDKHWDEVEHHLNKQGYKITQIDYRTPIREVFYHIQTSEYCFGYDGMWHYVARMMLKPTVIVGNSGIIRHHNPQAKWFFSPKNDNVNLMLWTKDFKRNRAVLHNKLNAYKEPLEKFIENR